MPDFPKLGGKVRLLRRQARLTQAEVARRLDISASYLNLIEHDQRALTAELLIKVAQIFQVDLAAFSAPSDDRKIQDLIEVFSDPLFEHHKLMAADVREFCVQSPAVAQAVLTLFEQFRAARDLTETLAGDRDDDGEDSPTALGRVPSEEVNEFVQAHMNWFARLEDLAADLWQQAELKLDELEVGLTLWLERHHGVDVLRARGDHKGAMRRFDPQARKLWLSETLEPSARRFHLAVQVALLQHGEILEELATDRVLTSPAARTLGRIVLANYFAAAVAMPYDIFLHTAKQLRYDIELLGHRFGCSFEQVCHRLTTLRKPGHEGVPLHMVRVDMAGNISKHFSASGIRIARYSGACPRWNIHAAFLTPGLIRTQVSRMTDGAVYFCIAKTVPKGRAGWHALHTLQSIGLGCNVRHARQLVYADGIDLDQLDNAVPVGVTCRLCDRTDCEQRAFPSLRQGLDLDENWRGVSLYMPVRRG